jgi:transcriptional regulator with XRE-family HTH domain
LIKSGNDFKNNAAFQSAVGFDKLTIRNWKTGDKEPSDSDVKKIATYFKVDFTAVAGKTKTALVEQSLSPRQKELVEILATLPDVDFEKVEEYVGLLRLKPTQ